MKQQRYIFRMERGRKATFTPRGTKIFWVDEDYVLVNATVRAKDGTEFDAVLGLDVQSSCEHCETHILLPNAIATQGQNGFLNAIGKTKDEFFPYSYRYRVPQKDAWLYLDDHHVNSKTGWSR